MSDTIWWCAVHNAQGRRERSDACLRFGYPHYGASCDMRPALVLVRDAEGNWPEWVKLALNHGYGVHELDECAEIALWNLAEAVK